MTSAAPVASLRGIRVRHNTSDTLVVDSLDVLADEILAIIGPNGAGKSTLLRVLGLLQAPSEGEVRLRGERVDAAHALAERRRMAIVFQEPELADMTVIANVELGLRFRGVERSERTKRARRWLDRLAIGHLADRSSRTLSGGEAQRVALARALVADPAILLADEPTGNLDGATGAEIIELLFANHRQRRTTLILVTHDPALAARCERVVRLRSGRLESGHYQTAAL